MHISFTGYKLFFQLKRTEWFLPPINTVWLPRNAVIDVAMAGCAPTTPPADPESRGTAASSAPRDRVQPITICSSSTGPGQTDSTNSLGWRGLLQVTCTVLPTQSRANWKIRSNLRTRQQANPDTADTLGRMLRANCPRTATVSPG